MQITEAELDKTYIGMTTGFAVEIEFVRPYIGGQPASKPGVEAYVQHHLGLTGKEADEAVERIMETEIRTDAEATPEGGEVPEKESYGINVIRRGPCGLWIGNWQAKAMLKQAASRAGLFKGKIGSKGDMSEGGQVRAVGRSIGMCGDPFHLHLYRDSDVPVETYFERLLGKVSTAQGLKSISHDCEAAPVGTRIAFEVRFPGDRIKESNVKDMLALGRVCGLGSARSLEYGRFKIIEGKTL